MILFGRIRVAAPNCWFTAAQRSRLGKNREGFEKFYELPVGVLSGVRIKRQ